MKGVILHGGHGSRLRPLTHTGPKQLIPVANKPISQYVLESLRNSGIRDIAIVLGNIYPDKVKEFYGDGRSFGVEITYIDQGEPKGIAHAIGLCKEFVEGKSFVVHLGDDLLRGGVKKFVVEFSRAQYDAMVLLCQVDDPERFGVAEFGKDGKLIRLVEKPKQPSSDYALTGIYFFRPVIFEMIERLEPSQRNELEITEAIQHLIQNGNAVGYQLVQGWWKDTGTIEDILESNRLVLEELNHSIKGRVEDGTSIQGRIDVGEKVVIKKDAVIRGPAIIGENTIVESHVYIGPYTSIGRNGIIKRGEIENSIVMDNCHIEIDGKITDSLVGPYSVISSNRREKPKGYRFILGERSKITI